ncbi:MAG: cytochrome c-type biogenesis protein CcmH [Halieaceae bacterium]|jgi:cytochrome c-type biogenesis protein CcmH
MLRNRSKLYTALMLFFLLPFTAVAAIDTYEFASEELRLRYRALADELRCPKCQNQTIAGSNSPIAMDLRAQLYKMVTEGYSDEAIIAFMVDRYGEFVRYRPAFNASTWLLWLAPIFFILIGAGIVFATTYRRSGQADTTVTALSPEERSRLNAWTAKLKAVDEGSHKHD